MLLIKLAWIDHIGTHREAVDDVGDVLQTLGVIPLDDLRPGDARIGAKRLGREQPRCVWREHDIVVAEQQEHGVDLGVEHRIGRRREPLGVGRIEHRGRRKVGVDPGPQ